MERTPRLPRDDRRQRREVDLAAAPARNIERDALEQRRQGARRRRRRRRRARRRRRPPPPPARSPPPPPRRRRHDGLLVEPPSAVAAVGPDALKAALLSPRAAADPGRVDAVPARRDPRRRPESVHNIGAGARPPLAARDELRRQQPAAVIEHGPAAAAAAERNSPSDNPRKRKLEVSCPGSGGGGSALARGQDSGASVSGLFDQMEFDFDGQRTSIGEFLGGGIDGFAGMGGGGAPRPRPAGNKAPRRGSKEKGTPTMCRCDNSGCLKRYCVCFAAGGICHDGCKFKNCANDEATAERKAARDKAIAEYGEEAGRLRAVARPAGRRADPAHDRLQLQEDGRASVLQCYQGGVACHEKCSGCANRRGRTRARRHLLIPVAKEGGGGGGAIPAAASRSSRARPWLNGSPGNRASIPGLEHVPSPGDRPPSAVAVADGDGLLARRDVAAQGVVEPRRLRRRRRREPAREDRRAVGRRDRTRCGAMEAPAAEFARPLARAPSPARRRRRRSPPRCRPTRWRRRRSRRWPPSAPPA